MSEKKMKSEEKNKTKTKNGWMNGRKERGVQGCGKGRNNNTELCKGGYLDPEVIWLFLQSETTGKPLP